MGTNFYFIDGFQNEIHIGKRSAAGWYCWDCGISLCSAGNHKVHYGSRFLDECPICGNKKIEEGFNNSTVGRELGFNKKIPKRKTGVKTCSSFFWAISPGHFADLKKAQNLHIEDEYGRLFSIREFSEILSECPIKFFSSIGEQFC